MVELRAKDVVILSAVLGTMVGTMTFFMHIFATGINVDDLGKSLRIGIITGIATTVVILSYTSVRYVERQRRMAAAEVSAAAHLKLLLDETKRAAEEDKSKSLAEASVVASDAHSRERSGRI